MRSPQPIPVGFLHRPQGDSNPRLQDENLKTGARRACADKDLRAPAEACTSHSTRRSDDDINPEMWARLSPEAKRALQALIGQLVRGDGFGT